MRYQERFKFLKNINVSNSIQYLDRLQQNTARKVYNILIYRYIPVVRKVYIVPLVPIIEHK